MFRSLLCLLGLLITTASSAEWSSFRGPNGTGVDDSASLPTHWDIERGDNVSWILPLDGGGFSSPVQWGDRLYLTTVTFSSKNSGSSKSSGALRWSLVAVDRHSGKLIWTQMAAEEPQRLEHHPTASHANPSPAVDGQRVVAIVGSSSLVAFDLDGEEQWRQDLGLLDQGLAGDVTSQWGTGSSPILWRDRVFVQVDRHRDSFVAAFEATTGKEIWRNRRDEKPSWSTPAIYQNPQTGKAGLVTSSPEYARGYDPITGKELWRFQRDTQVTVPLPVVSDERIYISGGYPRGQPLSALKTTATGDISLEENQTEGEHVAFVSERGGPYVPSPLFYENRLYTSSDDGILASYDATTGRRIWRERIGDGFSASPVAGDGKIYFTGEEGDIHVVEAGDTFELLGTNHHGERLMATPAIAEGTLYIRGANRLVAVRQKSTPRANP